MKATETVMGGLADSVPTDPATGTESLKRRGKLGVWAAEALTKFFGEQKKAERVASLAAGSPSGLALDTAGGKMYWTDSDTGSRAIRRANLDGKGVEDVLVTSGTPSRVVLDTAGGKMYWTESLAVRRANLDGTGIETLWTTTEPSSPNSVALDVAAGKVYWADSTQKLIRRANLDGSAPEVVLDATTFKANSTIRNLTLDLAASQMYWTTPNPSTLSRANLDGSNVVVLTSGENVTGLSVAQLPPGVSVTGQTTLVTSEGGSGAAFRVVLTTRPMANVTISVSSSDTTEGTVSVTSLTFTPYNWFIPQTVTISSVEDALVSGEVASGGVS